jgi:hypothetical protein
MNTQQSNSAHSLYAFYETLPNEVQQAFLEELLQKKYLEIKALAFSGSPGNEKHNTVILGVMENAFTDAELEQACGILNAPVEVSLAEIDAAIKSRGGTNDCS